MKKIPAFVKRGLCYIGSSLVIMGTLSGCYLYPKEEKIVAPALIEPVKVEYKTIEVKKTTIEQRLVVNGVFVPVDSTDVAFGYKGGRLKKIHVQAGQLVEKGDLLAELDIDDIEGQINEQNILYKKAQLAYNALEEAQADKYSLQLASLDMRLIKDRLSELKTERSKAKMYAPVSGLVVYVADLVAGQNVDAYKTVVRLVDPENLQVEYAGDNVSDFDLGEKVQVIVDGKEYEGEVVMNPRNMPLTYLREGKTIIRVKVADLPKDAVSIGQQAEIRLIINRKENVIALPRQLIRNYMGRKYVQLLGEDGQKIEQDVETGIQTATEVEIVNGLKEGDIIVER